MGGPVTPDSGGAIPVPLADDLSGPFWSAAAEHRLSVQQCGTCGRLSYPPVIVCPGCLDTQGRFDQVTVPGTGQVVTWTVVRRAFLPAFERLVPYVVSVVALDGTSTLRMAARLDVTDMTMVRPGAPVVVSFVDPRPGFGLPLFRLAAG